VTNHRTTRVRNGPASADQGHTEFLIRHCTVGAPISYASDASDDAAKPTPAPGASPEVTGAAPKDVAAAAPAAPTDAVGDHSFPAPGAGSTEDPHAAMPDVQLAASYGFFLKVEIENLKAMYHMSKIHDNTHPCERQLLQC